MHQAARTTLVGLNEISPVSDTEADGTCRIVVLRRSLAVRHWRDILEEAPREVLLFQWEVERETRTVVETTVDITAYGRLRHRLVHIYIRVLELSVATHEIQFLALEALHAGSTHRAHQQCCHQQHHKSECLHIVKLFYFIANIMEINYLCNIK